MPYEKHTWLRGETITAENLNHLEDGIVGEQTTRASQDQFINDRIDQIIAPTGEAPNPTEITDARIGVDDTVYNTLGTAIRTQVGDLKNAINALDEAIELYEVPTATGTTLANYNVQNILDNVSISNGKTYTLSVEVTSATNVDTYFGFYEQGTTTYKFIMTLPSGTASKSQDFVSIYDIPNGYIGATTNNRALNYTVTFSEAGDHPTFMERNEQTINAVSAEVDGLEEKIGHIDRNAVVSKPNITITDVTSDMTWSTGFVSDTGVVDSTNTSYKKTAKISVSEGEIYSTIGTSAYRYVCAYNGDTVVSASGGSNINNYVVPKGITHIIISIYATQSTESGTVIKTTTEYEYFNSADVLNIRQTDDITPVYGLTNGYINKDGYKDSSSTSYQKTGIIPVNKGDVFNTTSTTTPYRYVTAYLNGSAVSAKGAENVYKYTVPDGVDSICITIYSNQNKQNGTIYKTFDSYCKKPIERKNTDFALRRPIITFIDDDGYASFYQYIYPIMQSKGIPYCVALMGDVNPAMTKTGYLTKAQCDAIVNAGGEMVVHGGTNLTEFSTIELAEANVVSSKEALAAKGFYSDVYVYPNSGNNIAIREMIGKHFDCAFKTAYPQKYDTRCNDKCVPSYFIHRSSCGGYYDDKSADYGNYDTWTMDYFRALIDDTIAKNGWLVFMTHVWMMPIGCQWRLDHDEASGIPADLDEFALLESIIDYAQSQNVDIVTASEGFEIFGNAMQAGDYLGYWNENTTPATGYEHTQPGSAINKLGQYDFPSSNNLNT